MRLPDYFIQPIPDGRLFNQRKRLFSVYNINTVCKSAHCPNQSRCLEENTATFMILGDICSRICLFCAVKKGRPKAPDIDEPYNIAMVVKEMNLDYVIITSVTRDDLPDFGVGQFVRVVEEIRRLSPQSRIELLIPDFCGNIYALKEIIKSHPDCIAHNLETVPRLYPELKRVAIYERSLFVLSELKKTNYHILVKSGIILGLGESRQEVIKVLKDLRKANCDIVTIGQYLSPSKDHYPVKKFLTEEEFKEYEQIAYSLGFKAVLSGPLVRSSYKAKEIYFKVRRNFIN
jgi:lipoic acid synthetase